ncbi:MAG: hypothetical protein WAP51_03450 [Candidatus Sungiibacteriota bacterium]
MGGGVVIALLGVGVMYGLQYYQYRKSPEYQAQKYFEDLQKRYAEDTYGGDTPEETLQLFIDALKKGDVELASKYFILDKQAEQKQYLISVKDKDFLDEMIVDVEKLGNKYPLVRGDNNRFIFETYNSQKELVLQADVAKAPNGKWKILDL